MNFCVYLFDLDGTLIDSVELILASYHHTRKLHFGDRLPDAYYLQTLGMTLRDSFQRMADTAEAAEAMVQTYLAYNLDHHDAMVRPYAGVPEMLAELQRRGAQLGIVTGKMREHALRGLRVTGLEHAFGVLVGAEDSSRGKPDPQPVLLALERAGAVPADALFIGDSPHDIESGRRAGVTTAAAIWGPFPRALLEASEPDLWLEKPEDVLLSSRNQSP